ncbi:facilitated trehalose transporter Tret1-like [Euwallacea fornicatus]|uniref:facilitated trehalose transporter Tret1-like n=1 Tax=Euwallacea fornicatus TaxID=995702 RepID=UPI00338D5BD8
MPQSNFGKPLNGQDVSISLDINTDKRDLTDQKDDTGVVYRPTTMDNHGKWKESFQSLKPEKQVVSDDTFFLYRTTFLGNLLAFAGGIGFSWSSPVLPKLQGTDTPLSSQIDASQASLIASILCIGAAIGPFLFGFSADKIGRKKTLIAISLPMTAGMTFLAFTNKVEIYYLGRLLYGIGTGGIFTVLTMYTGEITSDSNRGKFSCILGIFVALGVLYPFAIGSFLTVKILCLSCLLPLQIFLIFFTLYAPDSPSYLVRNSQYQEAEKVLVNLRSISCEQAQKHVTELQKIEEHQRHLKGGIVELFRSRGTRKAFIIATGLLILQQFSGINAVTGFLENIVIATGSSIPPEIVTMAVGIIQVITVWVTSVVIEKLGRKLLLLASTLGSAVSIVLLGLYFFLQQHQFAMLVYFWWLPIACLLLYIVSFNFGLGSVPWTVLSEVFPDNVKSSASAIASATCFGISFVVTLVFPILSEALGMAQLFWVFGGCCVLGAIFIQLVMIETKGKNVTEIQEILSK